MQDLGVRVSVLGLGLTFILRGLLFVVQFLGFHAWALMFRVHGLGKP